MISMMLESTMMPTKFCTVYNANKNIEAKIEMEEDTTEEINIEEGLLQ